MRLSKSILLATALVVTTGSIALAQNISMSWPSINPDKKGGFAVIDPMLCETLAVFGEVGVVPPNPLPDVCVQYSMGHKVMNMPGYGIFCVTPMQNATKASIYAACIDCENESELIDILLTNLPMPPAAECPTEPFSDYEQRVVQHLANDGEFDMEELHRRFNCHHGKKTLAQPPEGLSRTRYIEDTVIKWMEEGLAVGFDDNTLSALLDLIERVSLVSNSCKMRECHEVNECNALAENILVDMLEKGIDFDVVNFEKVESIEGARQIADELLERALNWRGE